MPGSNALASHNGAAMELFTRSLLPDLDFIGGHIDATLNGGAVEIKSCQICITDSSHPTGHRSGRFILSGDQHRDLLAENGEYIFIVHREGLPFITFRAPASCLDLPPFKGNRAISWRIIVSQLSGAV